MKEIGKRVHLHEEGFQTVLPEFDEMKETFETCIKHCKVHTREKLRPDFEQELEKIKNLRQEGQIEKTLSELASLRVKYSSFPEIWLETGLTYYENNSFERALECFEKSKNPEDLGYIPYCYTSLALSKMGDLEGSQREMEKAILLAPNILCHKFFFRLGSLFGKIGNINKIDDLISNLSYPDRPVCGSCLAAVLYFQVKDYRKAYQQIESISDDCLTFQSFQTVLRICLGNKGDILTSIDSLDFPSPLDSFRLELLEAVTDLFASKEECDLLSKYISKISEKLDFEKASGNEGMFLEHAAWKLWNLECPDAKVNLNLLEKAMKYHDCPALRQGLLINLRDVGELDRARNIAVKSIEKFPGSFKLLVQACKAFFNVNDDDLFKKTLEKALQSHEICKGQKDLQKLLQFAKKRDEHFFEQTTTRLTALYEEKCPENLSDLHEFLLSVENKK
ncbi:MAG: tetratricopeptide repeat protein [Candidatus Thorarchaeota archaeon]